jgi:opacity protein-like surface antigen
MLRRTTTLFTGACAWLALTACSSVPTAPAVRAAAPQSGFDVPPGQVTVLVGARTIDDANDLDDGFGNTVDLGDHTVFGLEYNTIGPSGLGWESGVFLSSGSDTSPALGPSVDLDLLVVDFTFGGRYTFVDSGNVLPYVGGGIDFALWEVEVESGGFSIAATGSDFGFYAHAGVNYLLGRHFTIGADFRGLFGTSDDLDHFQYVATLGWAF